MKIGIVAHVSRSDIADDLAEKVDARFVSYDDGERGCLGNHRHVWERLARSVRPDEWAIVLEDDAKPVDDFRAELMAALSVAPCDVVSLYLGRLRPPQWMDRIRHAISAANSADASWISADYMFHAVGIAIRGSELIEKMLHATKDSRRPIDEGFSMWSRRYGHPVAYTWPSLIDHADGPPAISFPPDGEVREPGRVAWKVGTRDRWTTRNVELKS